MGIDHKWRAMFRDRLRRFEADQARRGGGIAISIKIRAAAGCFHREHSPHAFQIIDSYLGNHLAYEVDGFREHESGPELLVYLAVGTAGITLAKSVIDLVTTIIKARTEGIKRGDRPAEPLELIVRREDEQGYKEEIVLRTSHHELTDEDLLQHALTEALGRLLDSGSCEQSRSGGPDAAHE